MRKLTAIIMALFLCLCSGQVKTLYGEWEGIYGDEYTVPQARDLFKLRAVRSRLEDYATFISSETIVKNFELQQDQIVARVEGMARNIQLISDKEVLDRQRTYLKIFVSFEIDESEVLNRLKEISEELKSGGETYNNIKFSGEYLYGESTRDNPQAAERQIVDKIAEYYKNEYSEIYRSSKIEGEDLLSFSWKNINTFRTEFNRVFTSREFDGKYLKFIKKSDLPKMFEPRESLIRDQILIAVDNEKNLQIGNALRNYYWAYSLLQSLPHGQSFVFEPARGQPTPFDKRNLALNLHEKIRSILGTIDFKVTRVDESPGRKYVYFNAFYAGSPVRNLDFTYFDGRGNSMLQPLTGDGTGLCQFYGEHASSLKQLRIDIEYRYAHEVHSRNRSIQYVVEELSVLFPRESRKFINIDASDNIAQRISEPAVSRTVTPLSPAPVQSQMLTVSNFVMADGIEESRTPRMEQRDVKTYNPLMVTAEEIEKCKSVISKIVDAVKSKDYTAISEYFTEEGFQIFETLIKYGDAHIMTDIFDLKTYRLNDEIMIRSIPMRFTFPNNRRAIAEDVVFVFNEDLLIDNVSFGLSRTAKENIMSKPDSFATEEEKLIILNFMENYKTAFCLQRLDYINSIFAQNALIIVGRILEDDPNPPEGMYNGVKPQRIKYTRLTKEQYMERLKRAFAANEFINIRFEENYLDKVSREKDRVYGIQIKQNYYSTNYSDEGYLFLMMDLKDPKTPRIYVRSWQPEREADGSIMGINDFSL